MSKAYRSLAEYFRESGDTQQRFAAKVGCSQAHISQIAAGAISPSFRLALRISAAARIPVASLLVERES